jgi:uncharacterized protein
VVIFGKGKLIENKNEKLNALEAITNHIIPGRWNDARKPNEKELNATSVVSLKIDEASAKIRSGPPKDEEEDYDLPVWAGVIPFSKKFEQPKEDPKLKSGILLPDYINKLIKSKL